MAKTQVAQPMNRFPDNIRLSALMAIDKLVEELLQDGMSVAKAFNLRNDMLVWFNGHAHRAYAMKMTKIDEAYGMLLQAEVDGLGALDDLNFMITCTFHDVVGSDANGGKMYNPRIALDCKGNEVYIITRKEYC